MSHATGGAALNPHPEHAAGVRISQPIFRRDRGGRAPWPGQLLHAPWRGGGADRRYIIAATGDAKPLTDAD